MLRGVVIHEEDAPKLEAALERFLEESGAKEALLIDRSGLLLASGGRSQALDTVSISALAAGAFSSTGEMAKLLGETEFSVLFHQGSRESLHVSTVDQQTIQMGKSALKLLLNIIDKKGMNHEPKQRVVLDPILICRESSAGKSK